MYAIAMSDVPALVIPGIIAVCAFVVLLSVAAFS
jgi:hypothetical protein